MIISHTTVITIPINYLFLMLFYQEIRFLSVYIGLLFANHLLMVDLKFSNNNMHATGEIICITVM